MVFVLGAGASRDAGCPLMTGFFAKAQELFWSGQLGSGAADFEAVQTFRSYLQRAYARAAIDVDNLESVFTAVEMAAFLADNASDRTVFEGTRTSLVKLIASTLELSTKLELRPHPVNSMSNGGFSWNGTNVPVSLVAPAAVADPNSGVVNNVQAVSAVGLNLNCGYPRLLKIRQALLGSPLFSHVDFVSFNYDLAMDVSLVNAAIDFDYGLDSAVAVPPACSLLKMHGSLNWQSTGKAAPKVIPDWRTQMFRVHGSSDTQLRMRESAGASTWEPFIVPPTESKRDGRGTIQLVWRQAARLLQRAHYIVFVGFSLPHTDVFFREFFALGSLGAISGAPKETVLRHLIVVDPDEDVARRYESLLSGQAKRILRFIPKTFQDSLHLGHPDGIYKALVS